MDRYDAIIEHLKETQRQGLDTISGRFDSIADNIEQLIEAARSAVRDARPTDAGDLFPTQKIETALAELKAEAEKAAVEAEPVPTAGITLENLRVLDQARSQSELLRELLPMLAEHVGRAAVLVIRDGVISAWSGIGFADASVLRSWNGGIAASPDFQKLVDTSAPLHFSPATDPLLSVWLADEETPSEAVLLPINLRGKLMGIVYIDHVGDQPWNVEAAQALNAVACWLIDTLQNRTTVPSPMLAEIIEPKPVVQETPQPAVFEPPPEVEPVEAPPEIIEEPEEAQEVPLEEVATPSFGVADDAPAEPAPGDVTEVYFDTEVTEESPQEEAPVEIDYDFEPAPAAEPEPTAGFDPSATVRVDVGEDLGSPDAAPPAFEAPPPIPEIAPAPTPTPTVEDIDAPPPVRPIEPPPQPEPADAGGGEDDARHEEARRFARLLVSEIKLYNEDDVDRGRAEKNLGHRLKDDIDRSQEMYEKRIPADVREGTDYFREELVRILADGDADALGM